MNPQRTAPLITARSLTAALRLLLVAALCLLLGACSAPQRYQAPAPPLAGVDLDGTPRNLEEYRGKVVVVNVWASWCAPCRDEIPILQAAQADLGDNVQVLGLNMRDVDASARSLLSEQGGTYPNIIDRDGTASVEWGVAGVPMTYVVDREGRLVDRHAGPVTQQWIDDVLIARVRS